MKLPGKLLSVIWIAFASAETLFAEQLVDSRFDVRENHANAGSMSLQSAIAMVQSRFDATVVKTDVIDEGGHRVYSLRLLNREGRVWTVRVDAETGQIR